MLFRYCRIIFSKLVPHNVKMMSHNKLREEKNCLNCGSIVEDRYCSACGQENLEFRDSAFHLFLHYVQDLFHYDGKFWYTFKHFIRKPGLVPEEYMAGKRQRHLKPIQFYVFASTVFFLFFFFITDHAPNNITTGDGEVDKRLYHLAQEREYLSGTPDTSYVDSLLHALKAHMGDSVARHQDSMSGSNFVWDLEEPDSTAGEESNWLFRKLGERIKKKSEEMNRNHEGDTSGAINAFLLELLHAFPQLVFFSLPFFALFLQLLYYRSGKKRYVDNFIFSLYHYAYLYTILLVYLFIFWCVDMIGSEVLDTIWEWLTLGFIVYPFVYLFLSMRRYYQSKGISLFLKYWVLLLLMFCTVLMLFVIISFLTFIS